MSQAVVSLAASHRTAIMANKQLLQTAPVPPMQIWSDTVPCRVCKRVRTGYSSRQVCQRCQQGCKCSPGAGRHCHCCKTCLQHRYSKSCCSNSLTWRPSSSGSVSGSCQCVSLRRFLRRPAMLMALHGAVRLQCMLCRTGYPRPAHGPSSLMQLTQPSGRGGYYSTLGWRAKARPFARSHLVLVQVAAAASASACSNTLGYILSGTSLAQAIIAVRAAAANARVRVAAPPVVAAWGCLVPYLLEASTTCAAAGPARLQHAGKAGCCCCC